VSTKSGGRAGARDLPTITVDEEHARDGRTARNGTCEQVDDGARLHRHDGGVLDHPIENGDVTIQIRRDRDGDDPRPVPQFFGALACSDQPGPDSCVEYRHEQQQDGDEQLPAERLRPDFIHDARARTNCDQP
jgi:hypothetical protein